MQKETKIQKARNNCLEKDGSLLLHIEKHLNQVGETKDNLFTPYKFTIKKKEYDFSSCLDSEKSDNFSNLLIKIYNLLKSSNLKLNDKLYEYEKIFLCKIMELYDTRQSYSNILKRDVSNLYTNLHNLSKANLLIKNLNAIELPSAELLSSRILDIKPISDTVCGFDTDIKITVYEPNYILRHGIKMFEGEGYGIEYWGLEGTDLYIEYKGGRLYKYKNLDEWAIMSIEIARSFERTFQRQIKDSFEYERIE